MQKKKLIKQCPDRNVLKKCNYCVPFHFSDYHTCFFNNKSNSFVIQEINKDYKLKRIEKSKQHNLDKSKHCYCHLPQFRH